MPPRPLILGPLLLLLCAQSAHTQSVRDHVRLKGNRTTTVTEAQANELTLTLTEASVRPIQVWVRVAGAIDDARHMVVADLPALQEKLVRAGQRARAFSPETRSRMYQAEVAKVERQGGRARAHVELMGQALERDRHFVVEIVTEELEVLSVPNEAILDTGGKSIVYVQTADGEYEGRDITSGVQGERYTQILAGLTGGERVVTIGSFFIDAEHKLKGL